MRLRFYAKDDELVYVPNSPKRAGSPPRYVGRSFVPGDAATGTPASYPATPEPFECDSEDENGRELLGRFKRGRRSLLPADKATADACGVAFVAASVKEGVAVPSKPKPERESARSDS